jgi:hypothetical protein
MRALAEIAPSFDLRDPSLDEHVQSLTLFGLPLTEARMETNTAGDTVLTRWFERVRLRAAPRQPRRVQGAAGSARPRGRAALQRAARDAAGTRLPATHPIKGNINARGEPIYHVPGSRS